MAYIVLVGVLGGALLLLKSHPVEVQLVVDLTGGQRLEESYLEKVEATVSDDEGRWLGAATSLFPPALHPAGPPTETRPAALALVPGHYQATLLLTYGNGRQSKAVRDFEVSQGGIVRIAAVR